MLCLLLPRNTNPEKSRPAEPTPHATLIDAPFYFAEFSLANCFVVLQHNEPLSGPKIVR